MRCVIRIFANCEDEAKAKDLAGRLLLALFQQSPVSLNSPKQYWKIPEYYEFTFLLSPAMEESYQEVIRSSSGGWHHSGSHGDWSSVWNREGDHVFLVPEVAWRGFTSMKKPPDTVDDYSHVLPERQSLSPMV